MYDFFFYLQSTVRVAAPLDSLAPMLFSSTQEYRPLSSRLTFLMTRGPFIYYVSIFLGFLTPSSLFNQNYNVKSI